MNKFRLACIAICWLLISCDDIGKGCTEEFRSVGIEVFGEKLSNYYTIDMERNDTIIFESFFQDSYYVVLDDSYINQLKNQERQFLFIGENDTSTIIVSELFVIGADECHIYKISGKESIQL